MTPAGPGVPEGSPTVSAYAADTLVVLYFSGVNLSQINAGRARLRTGEATTFTLPSGTALDATGLATTEIAESFRTAAPARNTVDPHRTDPNNAEIVPLGRYLAAAYGLTLQREKSSGRVNYARLLAPAGTNLTVLAPNMLRENRDFIFAIEPNWNYMPAGYHPRGENPDPLFDGPTAGIEAPGLISGTIPSFPWNGFDTSGFETDFDPLTEQHTAWTYNEGYGYFQVNAHRSHSSQARALRYDGPTRIKPYWPTVDCAAFVADTGCVGNHPDLPQVWTPDIPGALYPAVNPSDPLDSAYWDCWNEGTLPFADAIGNHPDPDLRSHGTKVCGIIGARRLNNGVVGMIPSGRIVPFKISAMNGGGGSNYDVIGEAISRAVAASVSMNVHVMNISFGPMTRQPIPLLLQGELEDAYLVNRRFLVVASAGNTAVETLTTFNFQPMGFFPAAFAHEATFPFVPNVISVMSANRWDNTSEFSNWEDPAYPGSVTVSAPGGDGRLQVGRRGIMAPSTEYMTQAPTYWPFSGTSCAAPHVTGFVASVQAYAPELSAQDVKAHLVSTARNRRWNGTPIPTQLHQLKNVVDFDRGLTWIDLAFAWSWVGEPPYELPRRMIPVMIWRNVAGGAIADNSQEGYVIIDVLRETAPDVFSTMAAQALWDHEFTYSPIMGTDTGYWGFDSTNYPAGNYYVRVRQRFYYSMREAVAFIGPYALQ